MLGCAFLYSNCSYAHDMYSTSECVFMPDSYAEIIVDTQSCLVCMKLRTQCLSYSCKIVLFHRNHVINA